MQVIEIFSPNFSKIKRHKRAIKFVVIHYTGMQSEREALHKLCSTKSRVSSHYLINRRGKVFRLVQDRNIAWHAGKSYWKKYRNLNKNSIGIELVNKGHRLGYTSFKKIQILNLINLCVLLKKKYKIKRRDFVGHSDIALDRKIDPGEKFPWKKLAKKKLGNWHNIKNHRLEQNRKVKIRKKKDKINFVKNLSKIGYNIRSHNNKSVFSSIIKAFQRHFRNELISGLLDKECLIISRDLAKKT